MTAKTAAENAAVFVPGQVRFLLSAPALGRCPPDEGAEAAFVGRSNAGKSSVINAIAGVRGLARTSRTPGRTRALNFFALDEGRRLVDLPGYGYARMSKAEAARWQVLMGSYLERRRSLRGLLMVMDVRHPMKESDQDFLARAEAAGRAVHILLNKTDKLSRSAFIRTLRDMRKSLAGRGMTVQGFSALKREGLEEAREAITALLR